MSVALTIALAATLLASDPTSPAGRPPAPADPLDDALEQAPFGTDRQAETFLEEADRELRDFTAAAELESRAFLDEADAEYREFVAQVEALWGAYTPSTRPVWSSYSRDRRGHGEADYDRGTVKIEVLVDGPSPAPRPPGASPEVGQRLAATLQAMMSPENPAGRNALQDLVDRGDGRAAAPEDATRVVEERVRRGAVERRTVKARDGRERTAVAIRLPMVPDRLARSARPYLALADAQARRFGLERDLVLAVIHTESFFNPFARSGAPAYGLMQLVPGSGAREAWGFVHGSPRTVPARQLYRPEVNVELGAAYLHLLRTRHFGVMADPEARVLATIAAYNCGPGNTRRTLAAGKAPSTGASAAEVRAALTSYGPQETRQYVQLVAERRRLWRATPP